MITIKHKYGEVRIKESAYKKGMNITVKHAVDAYSFTLNKIKDVSPNFLKENKIITKEFLGYKKDWIFENKYGKFKMNLWSVLKNKTPKNYIDKTEKNVRKIKEKWPNFFKKYTLLGEMPKLKSYGYFYDGKYLFKTTTDCILRSGTINIKSCLNKTEFFIDKFKEEEDFYEYDFSLYKHVSNHKKSKIICKKHGVFKITTSSFLNGTRCMKCYLENSTFYSIKTAKKYEEEYKNKKAKVYVAEVTGEEEFFYKIGVTTIGTEKRFKKNKSMYKFKILEIIDTNLYEALIIENKILSSNLKKYSPNFKFNGHTECFSLIPNIT
jgi:hypothetical protein